MSKILLIKNKLIINCNQIIDVKVAEKGNCYSANFTNAIEITCVNQQKYKINFGDEEQAINCLLDLSLRLVSDEKIICID